MPAFSIETEIHLRLASRQRPPRNVSPIQILDAARFFETRRSARDCSVLFPTLASAAAALEPDTVCISILHTTDLHGHILPTSDYDGTADRGGLARCVTQIRRWRRQNPNSILVDVGDVYQGTEVSLRNKGELMIDLFNHLKYDAWVIGNHEFDWGIEPFTKALQKSEMPVLGANTTLDGKPAGSSSDSQHPFAKVQPFSREGNRGHQNRDYRNHNAGHVVLASAGVYGWNRFSISR